MVVGNDLCRNEDMFYMFENSVSEIGKDFMPSPLRVVFPLINKLYMRYVKKRSKSLFLTHCHFLYQDTFTRNQELLESTEISRQKYYVPMLKSLKNDMFLTKRPAV